MYKNAEGRGKIDKEGPNFKIKRRMKQGDPLSPNMFNNILEEIIWKDNGIKLNGKWLSNLRLMWF